MHNLSNEILGWGGSKQILWGREGGHLMKIQYIRNSRGGVGGASYCLLRQNTSVEQRVEPTKVT